MYFQADDWKCLKAFKVYVASWWRARNVNHGVLHDIRVAVPGTLVLFHRIGLWKKLVYLYKLQSLITKCMITNYDFRCFLCKFVWVFEEVSERFLGNCPVGHEDVLVHGRHCFPRLIKGAHQLHIKYRITVIYVSSPPIELRKTVKGGHFLGRKMHIYVWKNMWQKKCYWFQSYVKVGWQTVLCTLHSYWLKPALTVLFTLYSYWWKPVQTVLLCTLHSYWF